METSKILVVDDEIANLQKLRRTLVNRYKVVSAQSGAEALEHIAHEPDIAVIIADQRMPDMTGVELLRQTLEPLPHAIRIILTGFTDVDVLMDAINSCKVYRYIVKPWDPPDLLMTVERGLEAHHLAVENEKFRRELIRRERLARELEIAREIQRYILPPHCPEIDRYEIAAEYHPAQEVGGDLYDFDCDGGCRNLQIVIGDVSGKSIPAALYGAVFSGHIRAQFAHSMAPGETLTLLNANLIPRYQVSNYVAVAYLHLDLKLGTGRIANGGMPYPFLGRDGEISRLTVGGVPLGLLEQTRYEELEFRLTPGDLLVLISDGVTDAMNPAGDMYGEPRFLESLRRHSTEPIRDCVRNLYDDILAFTDKADIHDDITILALRRRE
jgi:sigma-B regulation protein RsbU (phosphoserine phosphatase)